MCPKADSLAVAKVLMQAVTHQLQLPGCKCADKGKWIELIESLLDTRVCSRCILRILCHKSAEDYTLLAHDAAHPSLIIPELKQLVINDNVDQETEHASDEAIANPCSLCLGLLQHLTHMEMDQQDPSSHLGPLRIYTSPRLTIQHLQSVVKSISADDREASSFSIDVNETPLLTLRQRLLSEHLSSKYGWMGSTLKGRGANEAAPIRHILNSILFPQVRSQKSEAEDVRLVVLKLGDETDETLRPLFDDYARFKKKKEEVGGLDFASFCREQAYSHLDSIPTHILKKIYQPLWPPALSPCTSEVSIEIQVIRPPLYLAGRYLKLQRYMPQTKWNDPATGQRIGDVSLAERLEAAILSVYKGDECKFIAGGREDADVRMLGEGRPFVMEVINAISHPSAEGLQKIKEILSSASDHGARAIGLTPCTRKALEKLKAVEESKEKTYRALCWSERMLDQGSIDQLLSLGGGKGIEVMQDTPLRVLHRRSSKIRPRRVWLQTIEIITESPHYFNLTMRTQAGCYVKEFVHGDLGRSLPNLGSLLEMRTEILQLDVLSVHMGDAQWP